MRVFSANEVKIYNLTSGKSVPDWLTEQGQGRKRLRAHQTKGIQLIQDFSMPTVSTRVRVSKDGQYVVALGTYKPRLRCFDVLDLGLKFERCFDSEAVQMEFLSDDYSKMLLLHCDRFVSLHAQFGHYYKLRIPRFGRDVAYNAHNCDAYFAGDGSEVNRLNLEQGRFLSPFQSSSWGSNVVTINPEHYLTCVGTVQGTVETWDPRSRQKCGMLDCVLGQQPSSTTTSNLKIPEITSLCFRDGLGLAVGTSEGSVMQYDLRSSKALLVKDHKNDLPIKKVMFHHDHDKVMSLDAKALKIWERDTGKPYTSIESEVELNDFDIYKGSGLIFIANEGQEKMQVHFLPSLGPAPKWCSFLDSMTEELEESQTNEVYDDYKFVTRQQLEDLGREDLIGSPLLRAYMHGYFIDVRLYRKLQSLSTTTTSSSLQSKVSQKMREMSDKRVELKDRPKVNREVYDRLRSDQKKQTSALLEDDRFKAMFNDERFAVDKNDETYKLLNPVMSKMAEKVSKQFTEVQDDDSGSEDLDGEESGQSDEDEAVAPIAPKSKKAANLVEKKQTARLYELNDGESFSSGGYRKTRSKKSLASQIKKLDAASESLRHSSDGSRSMTFKRTKSKKELQEAQAKKDHMMERQKVRRSVGSLKKRHKKYV